jgi:hypothetical protein
VNFSNSRRLKVNLGNYESYEFSAQATANHGDVGFTDDEIVEGVKSDPKFLQKNVIPPMRDLVDETIDMLLIEDIKTSQGITEEMRSVVLRSFTNLGDEPDPPTSRSSRSADQPSNRTSRRPRRAAR